MTAKRRGPQNRQEKRTPIDSLNPDFTKLLGEQPAGSLVDRLHPLYVSARDELPPYEYETEQDWMIVGPAPQEFIPPAPFVLLEATAIQSPDDTNPKGWPARNAEPTQLAITGSMPVVKDAD